MFTNNIQTILIIIALIVASITDLRTRTIPLWLFPSLALIHTTISYSLGNGINMLESAAGLVMCFLTYLVLAMFFNGGGGDIIMMCSLGWVLGASAIIKVVIFSSVFAIIFTLVTKKKSIPYAPCVALAYLISLIV